MDFKRYPDWNWTRTTRFTSDWSNCREARSEFSADNEEEVSYSESCYWPRLATRLCGSNWPRNSRSFVLVNGHPPWNKRGQSRKWNCRITALCSTTRQTSHVFVQTSLHWLKRYFHSGCKRFSNGENQIWDTAWHVGNARIRWRHEGR